MIGIIITVFVGIVVLLIEKPYKNKLMNRKEKVIFYIVIGIGILSGIMQALHLWLPNPTIILKWIFSGLHLDFITNPQ